MPSNTEVQARLVRVAGDLRAQGVELDPEAQNHVGKLIATAADRIERESRLDDESALADADAALRTLLRGAYRTSLRGLPEKRGQDFDQRTVVVHDAAVLDVLGRLCPIWPFC